jgi:hypothetical protein
LSDDRQNDRPRLLLQKKMGSKKKTFGRMGQPLGDELSLLPYEGALLNKTFLAFYSFFVRGKGI